MATDSSKTEKPADTTVDTRPAEGTYVVSQVIEAPGDFGYSAQEIGGAFALANIQPDSNVTRSQLDEAVRAFRAYVPNDRKDT